MKSYYLVSLTSTGGMYRDSQFSYGSLTDLQQALEYELLADVRAQGYMFAYDDLPFCTYIRGRLEQRINLFPFITIHAPNGVTFTVHEDGLESNLNYAKTGTVLTGTDVVADDAFWASVFLHIDWGAVPVLPLKKPILKEDESEDENEEPLRYGYFDMEDEADDDAAFRERMEEAFAIDPDWLSYNDGTVRKLAKSMYKSKDYSAMPVLGDALQEAGCENELLLWHCRAPAGAHARGSWLVERLRRG